MIKNKIKYRKKAGPPPQFRAITRKDISFWRGGRPATYY